MVNLKKWGILSLLTLLLVACSSDPERITDDQINAATEGKQLLSVLMTSSDDLEYDFPAWMNMIYVEDGIVYSQILDPDGLRDKKEKKFMDASDYQAPLDYDTLVGNFDIEEIWAKATTYLDELSENQLENYCIKSITLDVPQKVFGDKPTREITIQATKKGEEASTKLSGKRIQTTRNYYEFRFNVLDNLEIEYIEE